MKKIVFLILISLLVLSCSTSKVEKKDDKKVVEIPKISDFELLKGDLKIELLPENTVFFGFFDTPKALEIELLSAFKNHPLLNIPKLFFAFEKITPKIVGIIFTKGEIPDEHLKSEGVRQFEALTINRDKEYEWIKTKSGVIGGDAGFPEKLLNQEKSAEKNEKGDFINSEKNSDFIENKNRFFKDELTKHSEKLFLVTAFLSKNEMEILRRVGDENPLIKKFITKVKSVSLFGERNDGRVHVTLEAKSDKSAIKEIVLLFSMQYTLLMTQAGRVKKMVANQIPKDDVEHIMSIIKSFKISENGEVLKVSISFPENFKTIDQLPTYIMMILSSLGV